MKTNITNISLLIARLALTLTLLVFIFSKVSPNSVWQVLVTANRIYILLAGMLLFPYIFLKSYKWYLLVKELHGKNTFWDTMRLYLQKSTLTLSAASWIDKAITIVKSKNGKLKTKSVGSIDKMSELWIVFFFVLLGGQRLLTGYNPVIIILVLAVILLFLYQFRRFNNAISRFVPFKVLKKILRGFTLASWPLSNIILVLSFLSMSVYFLQAYLLLSAFQSITITTILMVFPLVLLTNLVPVTIGSLGIREGVAIYLLSQFGVPAGVAVSVSLLLFLFDTVIPGVLGSILFSFKSKSHVKKNK